MTKLYADTLRLAVRENLQNIRTLLEWAGSEGELDGALGHAEHALSMLQEVVDNLRELQSGATP